MADLKIVHREWRVEARFASGEVPDTKRTYGDTVMRPYAVSLLFTADGDREPRISSALLHGHRVNAGGRLGASVIDTLYSYRLHDWLAKVVDEALGYVIADLSD